MFVLPIRLGPNRELSSISRQLEGLCSLYKQGIVEGGPRGELIARFLLTQSLRNACLDSGVQKNYCTVKQLLDGLGVDLTNINKFGLLNKRVHFSYWFQIATDILPHNIAHAFALGYGIVCKKNFPDIDLLIPILLNDKEGFWKSEPLLPMLGPQRGVPVWTEQQETKLLKNFSAILIQVRNNCNSRDGKIQTVHDSVQHRADIIFRESSKKHISLYMQLGDSYSRHHDKVEVSNSPLQISLFGIQRYGTVNTSCPNKCVYTGEEMCALETLAMYNSDSRIYGVPKRPCSDLFYNSLTLSL
jgi:hypothetical protein